VGVSRDIHLENYQNWQDVVETENFDFNQAFNYPNPFEDNTLKVFLLVVNLPKLLHHLRQIS
jgi:hypothetical protein